MTTKKYHQLHLTVEHVRKKHVLTGCKHDMFCCQTFTVWSRPLFSTCHSTKYSLQEFLDIKNNFWRQGCCF